MASEILFKSVAELAPLLKARLGLFLSRHFTAAYFGPLAWP
jgi:hypothetical protein